MRPEQWLKNLPPPSPANQELQRIFLEDHWRYGGLIHEVTAKALIGALNEKSEVHVGHGLYLRLFTEYATVLETLGAWGWTMRNRHDYPSLLDGFLAYGHNDPREFYRAVRRNRSGSLRLLLRLPADRKLAAAVREGFGYESDAEVAKAFEECVTALRLAADAYSSSDEIVRSTYNKAKHGVTMFQLPGDDPRTFRVVMPHLLPSGPKDTSRYVISKFSVNRQMVRALEQRIEIFSTALRFLQGTARALHRAGSLS